MGLFMFESNGKLGSLRSGTGWSLNPVDISSGQNVSNDTSSPLQILGVKNSFWPKTPKTKTDASHSNPANPAKQKGW